MLRDTNPRFREQQTFPALLKPPPHSFADYISLYQYHRIRPVQYLCRGKTRKNPVTWSPCLEIFWITPSTPAKGYSRPYGIGMKNVEKTVRKYDDFLRTECGSGAYRTDIVLYHAIKRNELEFGR